MRNMMDANSSSDSDTSDVTEPLVDGDAGAETSTTAVIDQAATAEPADVVEQELPVGAAAAGAEEGPGQVARLEARLQALVGEVERL